MVRIWRSIFPASVATVILTLGILSGCGREPPPSAGPRYSDKPAAEAKEVYRLAIHPLHNPEKLFSVYQPLVDDLNQHLGNGHRFVLEASRDYQEFERKYRNQEAEFILPNPWQTLDAMKTGYQVIATAGDNADFKGIFIVRKDSGITTPADLRGKVVSYPSHTALAACVMPQYYLHQRGIDVNHDITNHYVGSQESSIMNAYLRESAAGATWPPPWRLFQRDHPREAAELKVIWETPPLMNNSVMARNDVPAAVREGVRLRLLELDKTPEGRRILAGAETARFHPANDASYQPVRDFVAIFEKDVRPVERK
jgi:phosphonate transport system substrate-binding protein